MSFRTLEYETHLEKSYKETEELGTQCVAYIKKVTNAPQTNAWRAGAKLYDPMAPMCGAHPTIAPGVAIATFDSSGRYPSKNQHAAIFLRYSNRGFWVQDQWVQQGKVKKREIFRTDPKVPKKREDDPNSYYVIEVKKEEKSGAQ